MTKPSWPTICSHHIGVYSAVEAMSSNEKENTPRRTSKTNSDADSRSSRPSSPAFGRLSETDRYNTGCCWAPERAIQYHLLSRSWNGATNLRERQQNQSRWGTCMMFELPGHNYDCFWQEWLMLPVQNIGGDTSSKTDLELRRISTDLNFWYVVNKPSAQARRSVLSCSSQRYGSSITTVPCNWLR